MKLLMTANRLPLVSGLVVFMLIVAAGCGPQPQRQRRAQWTPDPRRAPAPPPEVDMPIDPKLQAVAAETLMAAVRSDDPVIRAHAIEAVKRIGGEGSEQVILDALDDEAGLVRFAAAMAVGERRIAAAHPRLLEMVDDRSVSAQVAVRYALHRLGDYRRSHDLETFANDPRPQVRANTVMVLGLLDEPTGVNVLRYLRSDPDPAVMLQVAEALWRHREMEGLESLVAASQSAFPDFQIVALQAMAAPKDHRVIEHIRSQLTAEHTEVQLAAARALGTLGSDLGYTIAQRAAKERSPRLKVLAALALAEMGRTDIQPILSPLLKDTDPDVRVAAATGLLLLDNP